MIKKMTMHTKLLDAFKEAIHERGLPVRIDEGKIYSDYNDDLQVDILLEYDDVNASLINQILVDTINTTFRLV